METVNIKINGKDYAVEKGITVLEAARYAGIDIPTLCYLKDINEIGACRLCLVEVKGARGMVTACVYPVNEGMEITTNSPRIMEARKMNLELLLSNHKKDCLSCVRSTTCELQALCNEYGVDEHHFGGERTVHKIDASSPSIIRDNDKCILCRRCVAACKNMQGIGVIGANNRGFDTEIGTAFEVKLADTSCVNCGQCIVACPVGAIYEKDDTARVFEALADPEMHVAICTAPSVRAQIGECFGYEPGTDTEGKMVAEFEDTVKALSAHEVSDPVESQYGFHVIMRLPSDADRTVSYSSDGKALSARYLAASDAYQTDISAYIDTLSCDFASGFEKPVITDYLK